MDVADYWAGLVAAQSGIVRTERFDTSDYPSHICGQVPDFDPLAYMEHRQSRRTSLTTQYAIAAAHNALNDAGLGIDDEGADRIGVLLGVGTNSFPDTEVACRRLVTRGWRRINPFFVPIALPNMPACQVAIHVGARGYNSTVTTACAASTQAIGEAAEVIRRGAADVMLAGGAEAPISLFGLAAFSVMQAFSRYQGDPTEASRPFDANRDGFVPSEGAGILILESLEHALERNAHIYAEVLGYASTCDAFHVTMPDPEGRGAAQAIQMALVDASLQPTDVDYINAHGTATRLNDVAETRAIKSVFGEYAYQVPISSTKSMIGHLFGASGAVEAIACIKTIETATIHPTINYQTRDPECDLDYVPNVARQAEVRVALSNSFGFGGQNACLILGVYQAEAQP
jgi:3-oxoacyl-[acyl-carrier-protein] synthase II